MSPDQILGPTAAISAYCGAGYWLYKRGIKGINADLRAMIDRLVEGPRPPEPNKPYDCKVLHETAVLELDLYDDIVSGDVRDHVENCKKYKLIPNGSGFIV